MESDNINDWTVESKATQYCGSNNSPKEMPVNALRKSDVLLHSMRGHQLRALANARRGLEPADVYTVQRYTELCGGDFDTRNLSDKSLEEIQALCSKYFDQVAYYGR
jgi:hypothetical protein